MQPILLQQNVKQYFSHSRDETTDLFPIHSERSIDCGKWVTNADSVLRMHTNALCMQILFTVTSIRSNTHLRCHTADSTCAGAVNAVSRMNLL